MAFQLTKLTLTKKATKDEAAIYKYILEKFGERYADKLREKLLKFSMCSLNSPLLADVQRTIQN